MFTFITFLKTKDTTELKHLGYLSYNLQKKYKKHLMS